MAVNVIRRSWKVDRLVRPETLNGMTFQAESGGHRFEITGYDANGSMIAFGGTVTAVFLRPDNTDVALTGVLSNGIAQVTLTEECYQVPGRFGLAVFVNQNNTKTVVYDCIGTVARTSSGVAATSVVEDVNTLIDRIDAAVNSIPQDYSALSKAVGNITCPELRNGSTGNPWNTDSVTTKYIIKLDKTCDDLILEYIGNTSAAQYVFGYSIFKGVADGTESYEARSTAQSYADFPEQYVQTEPYVIIPMSQFGDYTHIAFVLWARSDDTTYIPLRIATEQYNLRVSFRHASNMGHEDINNRSVKVGVQNAAKMASPLKLVHFSDLHNDINALNRIKASAKYVCPNADNMICTGDMVANTYAEITSWWPPEIMTVIGNHDTASWDGSAYDWTALSMAQRDEMYISPFKAYWGITHTAGTSYYYKDYPTANIRLIVLDAMLYSGTPGAEATAQTSWLANLLASAITDSLHVIIAIHAPHGGSVPVACSFTKLGQDTMPVNVDCNTPDVVINTVATAIGNGLHFIGYICGHTHQDAVWDCTGDRSQFMYTVTCAAVDQTAQWINSDQYRTDEQDAFNVLTIDTASTTIKILRGGGANTDVSLRPRVSMVIDYSTGKIITDTYASGTQDAVVYGEAQELTDAQKAQARANIGAGSAADVSENTADITANANEITSLKSALTLDYTDAGLWENGGISSSAGTDSVSTTRLRTAVFPWSVYAVSCNNGYKFMIFCYEGTTYKGTWNGSIVQKSATWHTSPVNLNEVGNYNFRFVFAKSDDATISTSDGINCIFTGYVDKTLSHKGKAADAFATNEAIQKTENKIIEPDKTFVSVGAETAPNATLKSGFYCVRSTASKMEIKTSASYNTFYLKLLNDAEFYCESGTSIFRICTIKQGTESESGGTISITGQDCTEYNSGSFPDSTNKISLVKGDYIAVSATTSNNLSVMMSFDRFSDTIILTNRQIEQAKNATISALGTSVKSPICQYADNILAVYLPSGSGYIRYDFKHDTDVSKNADVWRVNNAYAVADDLSVIAQMTTSGEWECALHLSGRDDFSGGIAHGDEMVQEITFILDGSKVSTSDLSVRKAFSELRIIEFSYMYDPADHTTKICDHGSEHVFNRDGLTINQCVKWAGTFEATSCYMAMYPASKNGDDKIYMDTSYDLVTLPASDYRNTYSGAKSVGVFSDTANICAVFAVPKYVEGLAGGNTLLVLDNGGLNYHKMYYVVTTGKTVTNGEMWQTQTTYKLDVGE